MRVVAKWRSVNNVEYGIEGDADNEGAIVEAIWCCGGPDERWSHLAPLSAFHPNEMESIRELLMSKIPQLRRDAIDDAALCGADGDRMERDR